MKPIRFFDNVADQNSYLIAEKGEAALIDPGFNGEAIEKTLIEKNLHLAMVLITHGHYDHLRDVKILQTNHDFTLYIHEADYNSLFDTSLNYARSFNGSFQLKQNQRVEKVKDGQEIPFGPSVIRVLHTPGHSAGGVCYLYQNILFSGDTLFADSIGRTDLAGGSAKMMKESLIKLFSTLSNELLVYPGHEETTTIGKERKNNAFAPDHKNR